jgi:shikimate dehydrogenase
VISGETRVAGIIGDPVRHSLSPDLHNTAYRALGLDWVYVAFEVPAGQTTAALDAARALGLAGLSVTMPHKTDAARACDSLSDAARRLRSVNTVTPQPGGTLRGDSTDGPGFVRSLRDAGCDPARTPTLVLGAGGAARPVVVALAEEGAQVTVTARRPDAATAAAALVDGATVPWIERDAAARDAALVVNATPVGMGDGALPIPATALRAGQVVADLVYHPLETPLLAAARAAGATTVDGLGMLVHQAALQIEQWSGHAAPVATMREAVREVLS